MTDDNVIDLKDTIGVGELTPKLVVEKALEDCKKEDWERVFIIVDTGDSLHYRSNVTHKPTILWLVELLKTHLLSGEV